MRSTACARKVFNMLCVGSLLLLVSACMGQDIVTYSEFRRVQPNMRLTDLEQIVGTKGRLKKDGEFVDGTAVATLPGEDVYLWENKDGSNMSVSVINGRIVGVAQSGLH